MKECAKSCCQHTCSCFLVCPRCLLDHVLYVVAGVAAIILFIFLVWYYWRELVHMFTNYRYQGLRCNPGHHILGNKCVADGTVLEDPVPDTQPP